MEENEELYTKNGRPLQVYDKYVYSKSGKVFGKINFNKVYDKDGRYIGTIVSDRLVYRSSDSATVSSTFSAANIMGCGMSNRGSSGISGEEPQIPD